MSSMDNNNTLTLERLAVGIVEDAFHAALSHLQHHPSDFPAPEIFSTAEAEQLLTSTIMETLVVTAPVRKSSLISFHNRQLKDGRKRSVTFNPTLIQEYIIEDGKITVKPACDPERQKTKPVEHEESDSEEVTKL